MSRKLLLLVFLLAAHCFSPSASGHGSVVAEDDLCIIKVGYFQAHFKIYLPAESRHTEFCEDLPTAGEATFIMEYIHGDLGEAPLEFRIIHNVTGKGNFTRLEDIAQIDDLDSATVFYQPFTRHADIFMAMHDFESNGEFLGIITARDTNSQTTYTAVFPFEVGYIRFGYLPLFIVLLLTAQIVYWLLSRKRRTQENSHASASP